MTTCLQIQFTSLFLCLIVYGVDLTTIVKMCSTKVPIVVKDCIEELEKRGQIASNIVTLLSLHTTTGLDIDGIYRVPGKVIEILEIKKQYDAGIFNQPCLAFVNTICIN